MAISHRFRHAPFARLSSRPLRWPHPVGSAQAQTTLILDAPGTQVTDVMIQAGASANTNFNASDMLATRASTNYDYLRRALIKFDTQNTMPAKSTIQSAVMTLTVKYGGADKARDITVYPDDHVMGAGGGELEPPPRRHGVDVGRRRPRARPRWCRACRTSSARR